MGMISEFKKFAFKGNLVDVAIAFVMGASFNALISSFTGGIVSPLVGLLAGKDFSKLKLVLRESTQVTNEAGEVVSGLSEIALMYGSFFMAVIDFVIIAFICFTIIKAVLKKDPNPAPAGPTKDQQLLIEIRDALKK